MPGAGSTKGANYFASSQVRPDGLTIFGTSGSTHFSFLLDDQRVKFDLDDWHVVLASATGGVAYLPADLGASEIILSDEVIANEVISKLDAGTSKP